MKENALEETYTDGEAADLTKEELLEKMKEAAAELSSVKSEVIMDMDINIIASGDEASTGMQMDMTMNINMANEEIFEPYASHQTTTMVMSILGQTEKEVSEVYIREEDGEHAKYEGSTDENGEITDWERSIDSSAEPEFIFTSESLNELESAIKFTIRDHKAVDTEGKEYYVLESNISLNDAMEQAGMQEELQELLDELKDSLSFTTVTYFLCGLMDLFPGALRGMGRSGVPMILSILGTVGTRIVWIFWIFPAHRSLDILFISYPVSWILTILMQVICFWFVRKKVHESIRSRA